MPYKILSLDGGGSWALIQAMALDAIYPGQTGHQILQHFDLAIANSGGSIVLAGLIKNMTAAQIQGMFLQADLRNSIFVKVNPIQYQLDKVLDFGARYVASAKLDGLRKVMNDAVTSPAGSLKMSETSTYVAGGSGGGPQIMIAAFDYVWNREVFFSSRRSPLAAPGVQFDPDLASAVHASTNAPINYFNAPAEIVISPDGATRLFWDGAMGGFNNPLLRGVLEAVATGAKPEAIAALSLGTGTVWKPQGPPAQGEHSSLFAAPVSPGIKNDLEKAASVIVDDPPDTASLAAHTLTGAPLADLAIVRLSPMVRPLLTDGVWDLPPGYDNMKQPDGSGRKMNRLDAFDYLANLDMDATADKDVEMIRQLAAQWLQGNIPNQPILHDPVSAGCVIGFRTFQSGQDRWKVIG